MSDLMVVGPKMGSQGTLSPFTAGVSGAQRVSDAHARYMQAVLESRAFYMDSDSVTLAAANATKSALATAKFINGFANPPGSGKYAVIWRARVATVSGTPAGPYFYNAYQYGTKVSSAVTGTIRNALTQQSVGSAMTPQTGVVLALLPADTTALAQLATMGGPAAVAAGAGLYDKDDLIDGAIIIPPGFLFGLMCAGAGTSHVVQSTMWWEEVPMLIQS
jgi:hypothetical protein